MNTDETTGNRLLFSIEQLAPEKKGRRELLEDVLRQAVNCAMAAEHRGEEPLSIKASRVASFGLTQLLATTDRRIISGDVRQAVVRLHSLTIDANDEDWIKHPIWKEVASLASRWSRRIQPRRASFATTRKRVIESQNGKCWSQECERPATDVVTAKHLEHEKLVAFCRSCRLRADAPDRIRKAVETRARRRVKSRASQLPLFATVNR